MSAREWKPGDVAMARATGGEFLVVRTGVGDRAYWSAPLDWPSGIGPHECEYRPLVVIDPEDREQVERLTDLYWETVNDEAIADLQAALREFANPTLPKPDEPTGLGAVVATEADGDYVRVSFESAQPWQNVQTGSVWHWDAVAAVRVLSPGVDA